MKKTLTKNRSAATKETLSAARVTKNARDYLKKPYVRRLEPDEGGGFVGSILEFPGVVAEGDSPSEAYANLEAAAESWLEVSLAHGQHIKPPVDFEGCSGKVALRMPRSLHRQAAELAELEDTSLNQLLVTAIAHYVGGKSLVDALRREEATRSSTGNLYQTVVVLGNFHLDKQATTASPQLNAPQTRGVPASYFTPIPHAFTEISHG